MSARIFAIRAQPGLAATIAHGGELGLDITGEPLFEIRPVAWDLPDPSCFDALLIGSANAIRHGGAALEHLRGIPAHTVGAATAQSAAEAGFTVEHIGKGGLQGLLDAVGDEPIRYLRLSGAERVPLAPPPNIAIEERILYQAAPLAISGAFELHLRAGGIVLLHSAAAARHFSAECERLGIPRHTLSLATLGPRISDAASAGWAQIRHSDCPMEAALLALAKDMCQGS